ncbi:MAG: competence/damage-inducible protein A [Dehalococcoidales bacterium]|nr:competence/damage-inducible protein A [Dehalococcoidales bacterium]
MKAEIISIGTELLLGDLTDTNASYLAGQLPLLGIDLYWISQVGDNQNRLVETLKRAWQRSDLVLTTGGLGPTEDDLTREAIAELMGEEPQVSPLLEHNLRERFARRNLTMAANNIKQATVIPSAQAITNPRGTAPGWWVEKDGHIIVAMPGPPAEMHNMWQTEVMPKLQQKSTGAIIFSRTLKVYGIPEGTVEEMVSSLLSSTNPTLGIYAKADGIHLRFTAKAKSQHQAEEMIAQSETKARSILGDSVWGKDNDTLVEAIGNLLVDKGLSLAAAEYSTGGLLTTSITDFLNSPTFFKGALIVNSNEALINYGVDAQTINDYGVISPEAAQAMAEAARLRMEADIGISITGVVGPNEVEGKPVGTMYISLDSDNHKNTIAGLYPGDRFRIRRWAATAALFRLRQMLLNPD